MDSQQKVLQNVTEKLFDEIKSSIFVFLKAGYRQGGIKFEILWVPNFPVKNSARNNDKRLCHHPDNNQRKVVTNNKTGQTVKKSIY